MSKLFPVMLLLSAVTACAASQEQHEADLDRPVIQAQPSPSQQKEPDWLKRPVIPATPSASAQSRR